MARRNEIRDPRPLFETGEGAEPPPAARAPAEKRSPRRAPGTPASGGGAPEVGSDGGAREKDADARRGGILEDIKQTLGLVPDFFRMLPALRLAGEWRLFKDFQLGDKTALEPKVKELIGLAVAANMRCERCICFHTASATMSGATELEIDEALLMAKHTEGWSSLLSEAGYELDRLKEEMHSIQEHVRSARAGSAGGDQERAPERSQSASG